MLDRHCEFAYSVRKLFWEEIKSQPLQIDKTFVLLENRKWALTHTWDDNGIVENPTLLIGRAISTYCASGIGH